MLEPHHAALLAVPSGVGVVQVPQGIWMFPHSLTRKIPSCSLFCWALVSLFHIPNVLLGLSAKRCGFEGSTLFPPAGGPAMPLRQVCAVTIVMPPWQHWAATGPFLTSPPLGAQNGLRGIYLENALGCVLQGEGGRSCLESSSGLYGDWALPAPSQPPLSPSPPCLLATFPFPRCFLVPTPLLWSGFICWALSDRGLQAPAQEWGVQGGQAPAGLPRWGITHLLAHNMSCNFRQTFEVPDICIMCASLLATPTAVWHFQD